MPPRKPRDLHNYADKDRVAKFLRGLAETIEGGSDTKQVKLKVTIWNWDPEPKESRVDSIVAET